MTVTIAYFTGTGNSLAVAKDIARGTGAALVPIASLVKQNEIDIPSDIIGIVFPVYYGELPVIIKRFAEKLVRLENKYIFAVPTFGGSAGQSLKLLRTIIRSRGGDIAAAFRVHMPQNAFRKSWEKSPALYKSWQKKVAKVAARIRQRKKGDYFKHFWLALLFLITDHVVKSMKTQYKKSFAKISNASIDLGWDELIYLNDTANTVSDACTGCGTCVKVCPVDNIVMENGRPAWLHRCENCLACYDWCPAKAIGGGIAAKGYFYRHPGVKVSEIMAQKSG